MEEAGQAAKKLLTRPKEAAADPLLVREYVHQLVTPGVSDSVGLLLAELQRLQERAHLKDAVKAAMRKRYVCGLREVHRALQRDKARALIVAHNIEVIESEHGLDELMAQIMQLCEHKLEWTYDDSLKQSKQILVRREQPVPIIFAFTRRSLSRWLKRSAKTSCVAVLSHDGAGELFHAMVKRTEAAKRRFQELARWYPSDLTSTRRLLMRHLKGATGATTFDPLELHCLATRLEDPDEEQ